MLRLFEPFRKAVIMNENTDIWKPSYLLMLGKCQERLPSLPAMPSFIHFLAKNPLSFNLAEKKKKIVAERETFIIKA